MSPQRLVVGASQPGTGGVNHPEQRDKPYVVLVSLDGFRADHLDRFKLPDLQRVMKRGAARSSRIDVHVLDLVDRNAFATMSAREDNCGKIKI